MGPEFVEQLEEMRGAPGQTGMETWALTSASSNYEVLYFCGVLGLAGALSECMHRSVAWVFIIVWGFLTLYFVEKSKSKILDAWRNETAKREIECIALWVTFEELCRKAQLSPEKQMEKFWNQNRGVIEGARWGDSMRYPE